MSSSIIPAPWSSEEKIQLLLHIIAVSNVTPTWSKITPPTGRDLESAKSTFEGLVTGRSGSKGTKVPAESAAPSFTPANSRNTLKRTHDDMSSGSNADSPSTNTPKPLTDESTPAKKKRGRPPMAGGPAERRAAALARGEEIPKKKRGRPPKPKPAFPPVSLSAASVAPGTIVKSPRTPTIGPDSGVVKRGRGRPSNASSVARVPPFSPSNPQRSAGKPLSAELQKRPIGPNEAKPMSTPESTSSPVADSTNVSPNADTTI